MYLHSMYMHRIMTVRKQPKSSLRSDARALVEMCPGCNSRVASRRIGRFLDRALAETGFTAGQLALLAHIASAPDDSLAGLARSTGLDQSTLSRNLRTMEGAGLVEIAMVETDLRRRMVWLTELGLRRLAAAIPVWRRAGERLSAFVSSDLARRLAQETDMLATD